MNLVPRDIAPLPPDLMEIVEQYANPYTKPHDRMVAAITDAGKCHARDVRCLMDGSTIYDANRAPTQFYIYANAAIWLNVHCKHCPYREGDAPELKHCARCGEHNDPSPFIIDKFRHRSIHRWRNDLPFKQWAVTLERRPRGGPLTRGGVFIELP